MLWRGKAVPVGVRRNSVALRREPALGRKGDPVALALHPLPEELLAAAFAVDCWRCRRCRSRPPGAASKTRLASASSELTPFMKPLVSPKVIAPRLRAVTRNPLLPNCRCSIVSSRRPGVKRSRAGVGYVLAGTLMPVAPEVFPPVDDSGGASPSRGAWWKSAQRFGEKLARPCDDAAPGLAAEAIVKLGEVDFVRLRGGRRAGWAHAGALGGRWRR